MKTLLTLSTAALLALPSLAPAQESKAPEADSGTRVVPYCIEPMESMPEKISALVEAQFRCEAGTHLKRDSRPVRVIPSGEDGRPFVLRFNQPEKANAWYVRGFAVEPQK